MPRLDSQRPFPHPAELPHRQQMPVVPSSPPRESAQAIVQAVDDHASIAYEQLKATADTNELLRLSVILNPNAPVTNPVPPLSGLQIAVETALQWTALFGNNGRQYSVGVRVQVLWNTPGGWILVAKSQGVTGTRAGSLYQIQNGVTQNNTSPQVPLNPGEVLYAAVVSPGNGGVALGAQDQILTLVSDLDNLMSKQNRRFQVA